MRAEAVQPEDVTEVPPSAIRGSSPLGSSRKFFLQNAKLPPPVYDKPSVHPGEFRVWKGRETPMWGRRVERLLDEFRKDCQLAASAGHARRNVVASQEFLEVAGIEDVRDITGKRLRAYLAWLSCQGLAPKTIRNRWGSISRFLRFLTDTGRLPANPCPRPPLPRLEERLPCYLSEAETRQALRLAARYGIFVEVALALATGLRMGELRRLAWPDIDLEQRRLVVRKSKSKRIRFVPLSAQARQVLRHQRRRTAARQYVFPGRQRRGETGMRRVNWWVQVLKPLQEAIPPFRQLAKGSTGRGWHIFRHTFASRLVQKGVSLYKVSKWLGHAQLSTTQMYAHLAEGYDEDIERA